MINYKERTKDLIRFNNAMDVDIYSVKSLKNSKKGATIFDYDEEEFIIFIRSDLRGYLTLKVLSHETGHILADFSTQLSRPFIKEIGERRAENWACTYIVKYEDVVRILRNYRITNDFEAAEELGVAEDDFKKAVRRYELEGKPVKRWQFVECWES